MCSKMSGSSLLVLAVCTMTAFKPVSEHDNMGIHPVRNGMYPHKKERKVITGFFTNHLIVL